MTTLDTTYMPAHRLDAVTLLRRGGRGALLALAMVLYALGWAAARSLILGASAVSWTVAAVRLGWREGRTDGTGTA